MGDNVFYGLGFLHRLFRNGQRRITDINIIARFLVRISLGMTKLRKNKKAEDKNNRFKFRTSWIVTPKMLDFAPALKGDQAFSGFAPHRAGANKARK